MSLKKVVNNSDFCIQSGFDIPDDYTPNVISVKQNPLNQAFLTIDLNHIGDIVVRPDLYPSSNSLDIRKVKKVVQAGVQLAFTPIEEREDEPKKYAIRLLSGDTGYLNYNKDTSLCIDTTGIESNRGPYQCFFTEQEYNRIRKNELQAGFTFLPKFDPDNTKVFVPVEEDK